MRSSASGLSPFVVLLCVLICLFLGQTRPAIACMTNIAGVSCKTEPASAPKSNSGSKHASAPHSTNLEILSAPHLRVLMTAEDARHLLERAAIGAPPHDIAAMLGKTRAVAIQSILDGYQTMPENRPEAWMLASAPAHWAEGDMLNAERQAFEIARDREAGQLRNWWLKEMITTSSPQTERLVLFWQNHFVTTYDGLNDQAVILLARQNLRLRELAAGNFRDLVKMMIRDPAMLDYLDNNRNRKQSPNENLARELMELFTLGEGEYDEKTVKEAARALTGYSFANKRDFTFQFNDWGHDKGRKTLFGQTGKFDGDDLVDLILEQPATAEFMALKFWRAFVSEVHQDNAQITAIADAFRQSDYDIKILMSAILSSAAFWDEKNRASIIKSPVDLLVGTVRTTGYLPENWRQINAMHQNLGQQFYGQPNVAGWPGGAAWITPARLLYRWQAVDRLMTTPTAEQQKSSNGMMLSNNMSDNASGAMMQTKRRVAQVRLASEDYFGPPRWSIALFHNDRPVWTSKVLETKDGHDTVKFGRIQSNADLRWKNVNLLVDYDGDFDKISVRFLNDSAGNGGDRNLFVQAVKIDDVIYPAEFGTKRTNCPKNDNDEPGSLWCAGALVLTKPALLGAPKLRGVDTADRLYIGKARLVNVTAPPNTGERSNYNLEIGLQNLRFNGREWQHVVIRFEQHKRFGVVLRIDSTDCLPDCFLRWPNSAWTDDAKGKYGAPKHVILIPLNGHSDINHYGGLTKEDKKFVGALWAAFPKLLAESSSGRRATRQAQRVKGWQAWSDDLSKRLASSRYGKMNLPQPVFEGLTTPNGMMMMMASDEDAELQPAGRPSLSSWDAFELPQALEPLPLYSWLLASPPVRADAETDDIAQLLADPVYQLK